MDEDWEVFEDLNESEMMDSFDDTDLKSIDDLELEDIPSDIDSAEDFETETTEYSEDFDLDNEELELEDIEGLREDLEPDEFIDDFEEFEDTPEEGYDEHLEEVLEIPEESIEFNGNLDDLEEVELDSNIEEPGLNSRIIDKLSDIRDRAGDLSEEDIEFLKAAGVDISDSEDTDDEKVKVLKR